MSRNANLPAMPDLVQGRLYKVHARAAERMADDYSYALWDGTTGFVGLRTKFNSRFVDTELHYDASDDFGTVSEAYDTGIDCPLVAGWTAEQWVEAWSCKPLFAWLDEHATKLGGAVDRRSRCQTCRRLFEQPAVRFTFYCEQCRGKETP